MATVRGTQQVVRNLARIEKEMFDRVVNAAEASQAAVINDAKASLYPGHGYVTGNLQASIGPGGIEVTKTNITAVVEANAEYASFVEYGTSRARAIPFLTPALLKNIANFARNIRNAVKV